MVANMGKLWYANKRNYEKMEKNIMYELITDKSPNLRHLQ